ncbi:hypothetical protein LOK49_LG13G00033 [Camellia lanceoleosa]|uniref:Uncharacterized protein n=1 Tax=Camellia lanceoleosa TaxID=1840588 RepID=A0ACC0FKY5_9ERIC|nr:hypothetical protein LOK49_LG13G00033 [Camellia lanceoleosa]
MPEASDQRTCPVISLPAFVFEGSQRWAGRPSTPSLLTPRFAGRLRPGPLRGRRPPFPGETTKPVANRAKEPNEEAALHAASREKELSDSTADISALAPMKSVAKSRYLV